jgi:transposase
MPGLLPKPVHLTVEQRNELEQMVRKHTTSQQIALRARIILLADQGLNHRQIGRELKITRDTARCWRRRWLALTDSERPVVERLQDAARPGAPATFTAEQLTHLYAIACEDPQESGRPISHWTPRELADELINRQIVDSISPRHVGRLLEEADLKPHQTRYWLNPSHDEHFDEKVSDVTSVYLTAQERAKKKGPDVEH